MKAMKCPSCKGTGQRTLTVTEYGKPGKSVTKITCYVCNGVKTITALQKLALQRENDMWCRCKKQGEPCYHPDAGGMKHHWTCGKCGKVTQVG